MATANPISDTETAAHAAADLLVMIPSVPSGQVKVILHNLGELVPAVSMVVATPDGIAAEAYPNLRAIIAPAASASWTLTPADFANAYLLAQQNNAKAILLLGPESDSLGPSALHRLAGAVLESAVDLAVPYYDLPPHAGLVNSAILYPLTRALFAQPARFPLAIDLGLSLRMAARLAVSAQRFTNANQSEGLVWPVDEAAMAGFVVEQIEVGSRTLPQPAGSDINAILSLVTGSLFADIDAKAAYWQRARQLPLAPPRSSSLVDADGTADITPMLDAFRLAYTNLREIWSLVLPPNSLLGLKRLSVTEGAAFRMPDNLWARIVFDFLIAYRLRTINRGHLLGALIPLYLAWVASHINITASGIAAEVHVEAVAAAFEADKPYLVARWRWPDRFNP
jgi:glucosylglycerate synthase